MSSNLSISQSLLSVPDKLHELCQRNGWTQAQLAEQLDVRQSTISHWLAGKATPRLANLKRIECLLVQPSNIIALPSREGHGAIQPASAEAAKLRAWLKFQLSTSSDSELVDSELKKLTMVQLLQLFAIVTSATPQER